MRLTFVLMSKIKPRLTARNLFVLHQKYTIISECNVRSYLVLNAIVAQSKNCQFEVNTTIELKNVTTSDSKISSRVCFILFLWFYNVLYCVCVCVSVFVCMCVGFVMCGCFGNMYTVP